MQTPKEPEKKKLTTIMPTFEVVARAPQTSPSPNQKNKKPPTAFLGSLRKSFRSDV